MRFSKAKLYLNESASFFMLHYKLVLNVTKVPTKYKMQVKKRSFLKERRRLLKEIVILKGATVLNEVVVYT